MEDKYFQTIVDIAVKFGHAKKLAEEFEVAESTVSRWTRGVARPAPLIKKRILEFIDSLVEKDTRRDSKK